MPRTPAGHGWLQVDVPRPAGHGVVRTKLLLQVHMPGLGQGGALGVGFAVGMGAVFTSGEDGWSRVDGVINRMPAWVVASMLCALLQEGSLLRTVCQECWLAPLLAVVRWLATATQFCMQGHDNCGYVVSSCRASLILHAQWQLKHAWNSA